MLHSIATGAAGGQAPYARSSAHSTAAASKNPMRHNADHAAKIISSPLRSPLVWPFYAMAGVFWLVSVIANIAGTFAPGVAPQGAALTAVLAVGGATGMVVIPSIRENISVVLGKAGALAALGAYIACLILTVVLSYGTAASSRAQGIAHASGVAGRQESAKADEADARATMKRFANVPPTETLLAKIDALKGTPGLISECQGPQYSQIARDTCRTLGQLKAQLGDARARDAAAARLETAQGKQLVYADQTAQLDNLTQTILNAAKFTGRTWDEAKAADVASLVSVLGVEGLMSVFAWLGSVMKTYVERRDLGRLGNTVTDTRQPCDPDSRVTGDAGCNSPNTVTNVVPMRTVAVNRSVSAVNRAVTAPVSAVTPVTRLVTRSVTGVAPDHDEAAGALMTWLDTLASGEQVTVSQGELARQLGIAQQTVGRLLRLMQAQGLLSLHTDKRGTTVIKT